MEEGVCGEHLPAAVLPTPQVWPPKVLLINNLPPPLPHYNLTPFFFTRAHVAPLP